jgi:hypothetical protein
MTAARKNAAGAGENSSPLAAIRRQFPGWYAWKSSAGRYWATRTGSLRRRPKGAPAEWAMTVDADDTTELRVVLGRQDEADEEAVGYG